MVEESAANVIITEADAAALRGKLRALAAGLPVAEQTLLFQLLERATAQSGGEGSSAPWWWSPWFEPAPVFAADGSYSGSLIGNGSTRFH